MQGTVKWFQNTYGFITAESGEDYFLHYSNICMDGIKRLYAGDCVEFEPHQTEKGIQAVNVKPVLTLKAMKQKAAKEHLQLKELLPDTYGVKRWMVVDQNNIIQTDEHGLSLEELDEYFKD